MARLGASSSSDRGGPGPTTALARLDRVARRGFGVVPRAKEAAEGLFRAAGDAVEQAWRKRVGEEVEARLRRIPSSRPDDEMDPFGLDLEWGKYALSVVAFLHRRYFRTQVFGIENVPKGRVLLIANHSGQIPIDGAMIGGSLFFEAEPPRIVRSMVEKWSQTLPFVSQLFPRVGQVVGVPENARRLLEYDEAVLVFPEGSRGISKPFRDRYTLTEFGLGFMRLALETNTPIVPVAVIGAEEQYISFGNVDGLSRLLGMPNFPLVPQFFVPGLQLPLPTKYRIHFGEPIRFTGDPDDDDAVIDEKVSVVRATIQSMLNRGIKERKGIFF
jgi:1-acyl-sn-glycerol-3-phosphate acyltransferase